ncbi:hypothetical protein CGRA01v4_07713 [Colletotrichum graminicola]|nr:hypothetical protein CGRA01v4_07713 [Colletotrichum graminicola]
MTALETCVWVWIARTPPTKRRGHRMASHHVCRASAGDDFHLGLPRHQLTAPPTKALHLCNHILMK